MLINNERDFYNKFDNLSNFIEITTRLLQKNNFQYNENDERIFKDLNIDTMFLFNNSNIDSAFSHAISQYLRIKRESRTSEIFSLISEIIKEGKEGDFNSYAMKNWNCDSDNYMDTTYFTSARFNDISLFISERQHKNKIYIDLGFKHSQQGYEHYYIEFEFSLENGTIEKSNKTITDLRESLKIICLLISKQADKVNNQI